MRVLYIADEIIQSGAIKSFMELVTTMHDLHGVEAVVCTSNYSELNKTLENKGITTVIANYGSFMQNSPITWWKIPVKYILSGLRYFKNRRKSIKIIEESVDLSTIDLIHTNLNRMDIGIEIAIKHNIPNIMHIREFGGDDFKCWSYRPNYADYLNKNVTEFIAISEAVKKSWNKRGISQEKLNVIYNGVESDKIKKADPKNILNAQKLRLVMVGGVIPSKGQIQAVRAIAKLPNDVRNNVSLDIIGWSSKQYFKIINNEIQRLGLHGIVNVLGAKNDIYDRLCNYHVGLMCSKAEGFGRVTVEYMHAGLGVIASNCGANAELINDGINGLLYDRENTDTLAEAIIRIYNDRVLLSNIAHAGQKYASNNFTKEINASKVYNLYQTVLKNS
ncbi:MAG: glycosyltransferase family 4 protein [Acutalibacteraceae bacterium]